jgi:hypothetical protein
MLAICAAIGLAAQVANAELVVSVQGPGGESSLNVNPGDIVDLVVNVSGPDPYDNFFFDVDISPSLAIVSYSFPQRDGTNVRNIFVAGSPDDFSAPPTFESAASVAGDRGGAGTLIAFQVDTAGTSDGDSFTFDIIPDLFGLGIQDVANVAGQTFTLNIVPEPMTLALLGVGGLVALRRRRTA